MKIENESLLKVEGDQFGKSYTSNVDKSKLEKMFWMFSNLYKDVIGSIVREYTSNALDACVEAGIDEPVVVSIRQDEGGDYFSVKDKGIGMSPDRIEQVFVNYLSSTKEDTNDLIGGFGI